MVPLNISVYNNIEPSFAAMLHTGLQHYCKPPCKTLAYYLATALQNINSRYIFILGALMILFSCSLLGQEKALWLNADTREIEYPNSSFFKSLSSVSIDSKENIDAVVSRAKQAAQAELAERIRVQIETQKSFTTQSIERSHADEEYYSLFQSHSQSVANVELVGIIMDTYHDKSENIVHAFAYINKHELTGYYTANISLHLQQIEGFLNTARQLEVNNEKAKARKQYHDATPLLAKVVYAQDLLVAINRNIRQENLQQEKFAVFQNEITQALARLSQGVYVYIETDEDLFGQKVEIVANKVKAELAKNGCSFPENVEEADFILKLKTIARKIGNENAPVVFCYGDVAIEIYSNHKQKTIYQDEVSHKGGSNTYERAGRKAFEDTALIIADKIGTWIK